MQVHLAEWELVEKEAIELRSVSPSTDGCVGGLVGTKTGSWQNNSSVGVDAEVDKISSEKS